MKKQQQIFITILLFTAFVTSIFIPHQQRTKREEKNNSFKHISFLKYEKLHKINIAEKEINDEKTEEKVKSDSPDKFIEIFNELKTPPGKEKPEYEINYRFTELAKARKHLYLLKRDNNKIAKILDWKERGPANIGGRTRAIIVDPDDATLKTWYAGSVGGGIWKTTNGGNSWISLTDYLPNLAVTCLAMAPSNHNIIYAGTGEGFYNADGVDGNGIMKSTDKGVSWIQLTNTAWDPDFRFVNRIVVDPDNDLIVIAATNQGIFKSVDGGENWSKKYDDNYRIQDLKANPSNFNKLYAASYAGVILSYDAGETWVFPEGGKFGKGRVEIAVAYNDTNKVYASAVFKGTSDTSKLLVTLDGGSNWQEIPEKEGKSPKWLKSQGWYDNTIAVSPFNDDLVFVGGVDLWRMEITLDDSLNLVRTSTAITDAYIQYPTNTYVHPDHHCITLVPVDPMNNSFLFLDGNDGGVAVSYDGGDTFAEVGDNGYNTAQFYGVDKMPGESRYFGGMQDNGTAESAKNTEASKTTKYDVRIGGDGFNVSWHYKDGNKMIGGSQYNRFYKTEDGWNTAAAASVGFAGWNKASVSPFISQLAKSYSDPDLLYTITKNGVYKSDNFGNSWTFHPLDSLTGSKSFTFAQVAISIAHPQVVWAGAFSNHLYVSKDGGNTFSKANDNNLIPKCRICGLDTHPVNEATAYITNLYADYPKILRTTNYGKTWEDITGFGTGTVSTNGYPNVPTYCVAVMPYDTNIIWAGTDIGIIESLDNGVSWHLAENGLPQVAIWEIKIVDDEVVVATHGRGIWSVTLPELANHKPPEAVLAPIIIAANQSASGIVCNISLRSVYDSTQVFFNNSVIQTIFSDKIKDTTIVFPISATGIVNVSLTSYKGTHTYSSSSVTVELHKFNAVTKGYVTKFETGSDDFILDGLTIETIEGFPDASLNSPHPYHNVKNSTALLKTPIIVAASDADVKYSDIAIIEEGESGSNYGDNDFYDYVVLEGNNGNGWIALADGYDARLYNDWHNAYTSQSSGTPSMYKSHTINLLDKFSAGDTVLIRFRLFADQFTNGWGWSVNDFAVQEQFVGVETDKVIPNKFELMQNYPNPFNPSTKISFALPTECKVKIEIFNTLGELITTLVNGIKPAGVHTEKFNGSNLASGVYLYRIDALSVVDGKEFYSVKKMVLIK